MTHSIAFQPSRLAVLWLLLAAAMTSTAYAQKPISFQTIVHPNSTQSGFNIQFVDKQISTNELNMMLQPAGGMVLRVTSIHGYLTGMTDVPNAFDYAVIYLGASKRGSMRQFGAGSISLNGAGTTQINFDPGLVATLLDTETLALRSLLQSNRQARIEIHGYIEDAL
ncbi:MAG: hypothetical protein Tsb002_26940 [Wenzhouxiangellaceae bacterium]